MKKLLLALISVAAVTVTAQPRKMTQPAPVSTAPSYRAGNDAYNDITGRLGFAASAVNFGVDYNRMSDGSGFGGYFFMQTEKKNNNVIIMPQALIFGASYKVLVADTNSASAYIAPGVGIAMLKEVGANANGTASDETIFGPSLKIGGQIKLTSTMAMGVEAASIANWFNDKVVAGALVPLTSIGLTFSFRF